MDNQRLLKSYLWHDGQCFFVSTVSRDSDCSAAPGMRHVESIAWKYDWDKSERGDLIAMNGHNHDGLWLHNEMCEQLFRHGHWTSKRADEALENRNVSTEELSRFRRALKTIADYGKQHGGCCPYGCDTPSIAIQALDE